MLIRIDMASEVPIYLQLRNEIVKGIGRGELKRGDSLPTVRQMAADIGVNPMTVNKSYTLLKQEGFLQISRREGALVCPKADINGLYYEKVEAELELLVAESALKGIGKQAFLAAASSLFDRLDKNACPVLP